MVGVIAVVEPHVEFGIIRVAVGRNEGPVIKSHQQRWIIQPTIRVDHEAGEVGKHYRAVKQFAKRRGHTRRSDIPRDVTLHVF